MTRYQFDDWLYWPASLAPGFQEVHESEITRCEVHVVRRDVFGVIIRRSDQVGFLPRRFVDI